MPRQILYDGIRRMTCLDAVLAGLGDLDRHVVVSPALPPGDPQADDARILDASRERVALRKLIRTDDDVSFDRARAVYSLLAADILRLADPAKVAAPETVASGRGAAFRQQIDDDLARTSELDSQAWLGLPPSSDSEEIVRAIEAKILGYAELLRAIEGDDDLRSDIEMMLGRAGAMLRLARRSEPAPASVPGASAPPPPVASPKAPAVQAVANNPQAAEPAPISAMELEHLMMEAAVHVMAGDLSHAIQSYARLVELKPNDAALRLRLATTMAQWPQTAKEAERQFMVAVELLPNDADLRFQFGLYYKAMRVHSRSIAEFRAAIEIDPRHTKARAALESLAPKESLLGGFKKLLD
jgi:tetratricopeptide (TPR) repeat protein